MPTTYRVGLFLMDSHNAYQKALVTSCEEAGRRLGVKLDVHFSESNASAQAVAVQRFVAAVTPEERAGIILLPIRDVGAVEAARIEQHPLYKLADRALAAGVGLVLLNRLVEPLVDALTARQPAVPVGVIRPDGAQIGQIQAEQLMRLVPRGGQILYVMGDPAASSSLARHAGMVKGLGGWTRAVACIDGYWKTDVAEQAVLAWISSPLRRGESLHLIACQNDDMAAGALAARDRAATALQRPELRAVPVTGVDGVPDGGRAWVDQGKLAATVIMPQTAVHALTFLAQAWGIPAANVLARILPKTVMPSTSYPSVDALGARA